MKIYRMWHKIHKHIAVSLFQQHGIEMTQITPPTYHGLIKCTNKCLESKIRHELGSWVPITSWKIREVSFSRINNPSYGLKWWHNDQLDAPSPSPSVVLTLRPSGQSSQSASRQSLSILSDKLRSSKNRLLYNKYVFTWITGNPENIKIKLENLVDAWINRKYIHPRPLCHKLHHI